MDDKIPKHIMHLAEMCQYDVGHSHQVTRLALRLFDELHPLHLLGEEERFWLHAAGILHDIGWIEGPKGHHKRALRIILRTSVLQFNNRERLIIGSIARYHRRALPKKKHGHFAALKAPERDIVEKLSAILRVADGLDRTHRNRVQDLSCEITPEHILIQCSVDNPAEAEHQAALKKGQLLKRVFKRNLVIEWQQST
jgi:exopolyphosphatase/guanosine-5'-triphosphate,3'-diphosphate pyrophosphatase